VKTILDRLLTEAMLRKQASERYFERGALILAARAEEDTRKHCEAV